MCTLFLPLHLRPSVQVQDQFTIKHNTAVKMLLLYILIFTRDCELHMSLGKSQTFNNSSNDCQQHTSWEFLITEQACRVLVWWVLTLIVDYAVIPLIWTEESLVVDTPVLFSVFSVAFVRAYNLHIKAAGLLCSLSVSLTSFWKRWCNRKALRFCSITKHNFVSNVYWTVHHCNSWRLREQLDVTCYFISLLMCSTCFRH